MLHMAQHPPNPRPSPRFAILLPDGSSYVTPVRENPANSYFPAVNDASNPSCPLAGLNKSPMTFSLSRCSLLELTVVATPITLRVRNERRSRCKLRWSP
jgi:hypothetical protein